MFLNDQLEERIQHNEKKFQELGIQIEKLDEDINKFMGELPLTIEQLNTFLADESNFTEEEWQELQNLRQKLDEKLQRELDNIRNPVKIKKNYDDRNVQRHWLYVR